MYTVMKINRLLVNLKIMVNELVIFFNRSVIKLYSVMKINTLLINVKEMVYELVNGFFQRINDKKNLPKYNNIEYKSYIYKLS